MMAAAGAVGDAPYVDDVFSTNVYVGSGSGQVINNGIDNSSEGGMVWFKRRDGTYDHQVVDTIRGGNKGIRPNLSNAEITTSYISSFNNNGYTLGTESAASGSGDEFAAWNFRKAPGFFDVVTYTGNGSNRTISHSLGSIPGMIIIKRTDTSSNWAVYHRGFNGGVNPEQYVAFLDTTDAEASHAASWNNSPPTSSVFHVGTHARVNGNGGTFVAYVFAGGESTAATARSVDLDGSGDYLSTSSSSSDFTMGTGDFTIECWAKPNANSSDQPLFQISDNSGGFKAGGYDDTLTVWHRPGGNWVFCANGSEQEISGYKPAIGVWYHMALVRNSGTTTLYVNGRKINSATDSTNYNGTYFVIGGYYSSSYVFNGLISNFRVVKGTAVYTSAFNPPTSPLTNITNTKLLCCNNSSTTGSTVTPVTINANGNPTASIDSPFADSNEYVFGENEDQNVIKCGSYVGNGSTTGPEINIGWEPQWIMIKWAEGAEGWLMFDCMRGITNGVTGFGSNRDTNLYANENSAEPANEWDWLDISATGFQIKQAHNHVNQNGSSYIYLAIRRPDGYVGKPAEAGTDVFDMDVGNSSSTIPSFDTTFNVDFALARYFGSTDNWFAVSRLMQGHPLLANSTGTEDTQSWAVFDANNGWGTGFGSSRQSWMWKRHAGFDVVCYTGVNPSSDAQSVSHGLGKVPEMMWLKKRSGMGGWNVYHKGLNGGTNPEQYSIQLNTDAAEGQYATDFNNTAPTSTHFTVGPGNSTNQNGATFIAMLFASVSGISKVGYYDGSESEQTITTGFQPRFVIIKRVNNTQNWYVLDTTRGWASGVDQFLQLNQSAAQDNSYDLGAPTSTGFTLTGNNLRTNNGGDKYIYYCHA